MNKDILNQVNTLIDEDGLYDTHLESVKIFKTSTHVSKTPLLYDMWIILVLQNKKIVSLEHTVFEYDAQNYFFSSSTLPFNCETFASKEEPFITLIISIDKKSMYQILNKIPKNELNIKKQNNLGVFSDEVSSEIEDITLRLLKVLQSKTDSDMLGESLINELYYRIARGKNSHFLHQMFMKSTAESKISRTLKKIHDTYVEHLDVEHLAREEDMSRSSFHTHFKNITSHTPIQYIKKLRLGKAKDLIALDNYQVNQCAYAVGYESVSQFSRDFKKYFGYSPKEAKPSFEVHELVENIYE